MYQRIPSCVIAAAAKAASHKSLSAVIRMPVVANTRPHVVVYARDVPADPSLSIAHIAASIRNSVMTNADSTVLCRYRLYAHRDCFDWCQAPYILTRTWLRHMGGKDMYGLTIMNPTYCHHVCECNTYLLGNAREWAPFRNLDADYTMQSRGNPVPQPSSCVRRDDAMMIVAEVADIFGL